MDLPVTIPAHLSYTGITRQAVKGIDACLAPIVRALNEAGIETSSSCCGHGKSDGNILLADGRELVIRNKADLYRGGTANQKRNREMNTTTKEASAYLLKVYVASRASVPERGQMWRKLHSDGLRITSSWIWEDGEGQTASLSELWERIVQEIAEADYLILYAEAKDFPLKGAFIEAGVALGMGKPIFVCLPNVELDPLSLRPIGSWITHPLVTRVNTIEEAMFRASQSQ